MSSSVDYPERRMPSRPRWRSSLERCISRTARLQPAAEYAAHTQKTNGKTVGIDAATLEANATLRSIVRRDSEESYQDFLTKLAHASGIETPHMRGPVAVRRTRLWWLTRGRSVSVGDADERC